MLVRELFGVDRSARNDVCNLGFPDPSFHAVATDLLLGAEAGGWAERTTPRTETELPVAL